MILATVPEARVIGDAWMFRVYYSDPRSGAPVSFAALGVAPKARFLDPANAKSLDLTVGNGAEIFSDADGAVDFTVPQGVTADLSIGGAGSGLPPSVRLQAMTVDGAGIPKTYGIKVVQPLDPMTTDLTRVPPPSAFFVDIGPRGPGAESNSLFWRELDSATVQSSGFIGPGRPSGSTQGQPCRFAVFYAEVTTTVAGTLSITNDDASSLVETIRVKPNATVRLRTPVLGSSFHSTFAPDTEATVSLVNGYTSVGA